nr:MAG TPA: protein of unknown function (DUF4157) [Caudoviricetes sp.]
MTSVKLNKLIKDLNAMADAYQKSAPNWIKLKTPDFTFSFKNQGDDTVSVYIPPKANGAAYVSKGANGIIQMTLGFQPQIFSHLKNDITCRCLVIHELMHTYQNLEGKTVDKTEPALLSSYIQDPLEFEAVAAQLAYLAKENKCLNLLESFTDLLSYIELDLLDLYDADGVKSLYQLSLKQREALLNRIKAFL